MAPLGMYETVIVLLELALLLQWTNGHGRLLEPPSRSSMWRLGFNRPPNYNDNALYCGGFANQYDHNGGKCGICGDPFQGPRENEAGGKYATGTIVRKYVQGQTIPVTVQVTANHLGWFEFKLCRNNNPLKAATPECLDRHVLQLADGSGSKLYIGTTVGNIDARVRLPDHVTCSQCVLQWRWHTGNSYGQDPSSGRSCKGCGHQEEFYGCSDVQIVSANQQPPRLHLSSPSLGLGSYGQSQNGYNPNSYGVTPSGHGTGQGNNRGGSGLRQGDEAVRSRVILDSVILGQSSPGPEDNSSSSKSQGESAVAGNSFGDGQKDARNGLDPSFEART